ncbi:MAG TPA: permease, partial [Desulfurivibrionaceae bacterium]|nr:permease [Desulfurivibrionaceae bacterium]
RFAMQPLNIMQPPPVAPQPDPVAVQRETRRQLALTATALVGWWLVYRQLPAFANLVAFRLLGLAPGSRLGEAVRFFVYDTPKVLMLLSLVVFAVGILRSFFTPEQARRLLAGRRETAGNVMAAGLGVFTPFCSCSAVPLFIGFVTAGVPLGVTFSFLIAAPMVNEIALVLLYGLLGWKVALLYLVTGLLIAILAGWIIGRLKLERFIEPWVFQTLAAANASPSEHHTWPWRLRYGWDAMTEIVGKVWPYVLLGIAVGAAMHGYVPAGFMAQIMGKGAWWSVPVAVVIGIPMYANAASIVPVIHVLLEKGAALGTALAFMMSVIALSLPEMVILRKVLKPGLIVVFIGVVGTGILLVGYLFNLII